MSTIADWYDFVLQQMAAESYLNGIDFNNDLTVKLRLRAGNSPIGFPESGYTRLTDLQAQYFVDHFQIIDHRSDDDLRFANSLGGNGSGFSATLIYNADTNEYTLSFRSTEYLNQSQGGDWERDGAPGADGEIASYGFAFGQLAAMEEYYDYLKSGGKLPAGAVLNVTGYSLGGHLATAFTAMHPEVNHAYTFNPGGLGAFDVNVGSLADMVAYFRAVLANPDAATEIPINGVPGWSEYQAALQAQGSPWPTNLHDSSDFPGTQPDARYEWARIVTRQHFHTSGASLPQGVVDASLNAKITQLYGEATHGDYELVANSGVHAAPTKLFIEDQPDIQAGNRGQTTVSFLATLHRPGQNATNRGRTMKL